MDVRLPDGSVIKNVPDGMTKDQLVQKLSANGYDTSWHKPEPAAAPASFGERFKDELLTSLPGGVARGVKDVIDTGAGYLSRLGGQGEVERIRSENDAGKADFTAAQGRAGAGGSDVARLGGQILATTPVAGIVGTGVKALGATRLGNAIASSGFTTGAPAAATLGGRAADMGLRMLGGGAAGGAAAGLVDPEQAGTGAIVGAALPPALKVAGKASGAMGRVFSGPAVPEAVRKGAAAAYDAGYVLPPSQAKPTLGNRLMEGMAGKISTAQNASARNQEVTNRLAKESLGLADDAPLSIDSLKAVRSAAGQAYEAVRGVGLVQADDKFIGALDDILKASEGAGRSFPGLAKNPVADTIQSLKQPAFDAGDAVDAIRVLRESADGAFGKGEKAAGKAYRAASDALEGALERHLQSAGNADALNAFRGARQMIAKTYSVEKALNPASGNVEASKLAGLLKRQKPLSGGLKTIAEVAAQFPKAMQPVERMGSLPQLSPLDWIGGGALSAATGNPLLMAGIAARPGARSLALSPMVQKRLASDPATAGVLTGLLGDPALQLGYRAAPLLSSSR